MQVVLLVTEKEWQALVTEVEQLRQTVADLLPRLAPPPPPDLLLTVREAAHYMHISPEGVRKARRAGRLTGVKLNGKEWGFRQSELNRYQSRYHRARLDNPPA